MDAFELLRSREEISAGRVAMIDWYSAYERETLVGYLSQLRLAPGVVDAFARLKAEGIKIALVSITWQFAVDWLAARLGADYAVGTGWSGDGQVEHFWPEDKALWLQSLLDGLKLDRNAVVAVGDSHGDIPMLAWAGRGYFVGNTLPDEIAHVHHWPDADILAIVDHILKPANSTGMS